MPQYVTAILNYSTFNSIKNSAATAKTPVVNSVLVNKLALVSNIYLNSEIWSKKKDSTDSRGEVERVDRTCSFKECV